MTLPGSRMILLHLNVTVAMKDSGVRDSWRSHHQKTRTFATMTDVTQTCTPRHEIWQGDQEEAFYQILRVCGDSIGFFGGVINTMISKISGDLKHKHDRKRPWYLSESWGSMMVQIGNDGAAKGPLLGGTW